MQIYLYISNPQVYCTQNYIRLLKKVKKPLYDFTSIKKTTLLASNILIGLLSVPTTFKKLHKRKSNN